MKVATLISRPVKHKHLGWSEQPEEHPEEHPEEQPEDKTHRQHSSYLK